MVARSKSSDTGLTAKQFQYPSSDNKRLALASELQRFPNHLSQPLIQWSGLTGWENWGINIFPLGRRALQSRWDNIAGKTMRNVQVPSISLTCANLQWLSKIVVKLGREKTLTFSVLEIRLSRRHILLQSLLNWIREVYTKL